MDNIAASGTAVPESVPARPPLPPQQLRWRCDPGTLRFETTSEVPPLESMVGQDRGSRAVDFGISLDHPGYNIFVAGPRGTGRSTVVRQRLREAAARRPAPADWCYLHNFQDPYRPIAVRLPAGQAPELKQDMDRFIAGCHREIPRVLESEQFQERRGAIVKRLENQRDALLETLRQTAEQREFSTQITPMGVVNVPMLGPGKPLTPEAFELLPESKQAEIRAAGQELQRLTEDCMLDIRRLERETREQLRTLEREAALFAVGHLLGELRTRYAAHARVVEHLRAVENDLLDHLDEFRSAEPRESPPFISASADERYRVNVLVSQGKDAGAPVVFEPNPTYYNLLGRIDYRAMVGAMATDFTLVKPGALHRSNGGFLAIQARDLLVNPFAWDALKRALRDAEIRVENLGEQFSSFPTASLKPEPIPLNVKVVLIGDLLTYLLLFRLDEDFAKLFKVKSEFAAAMPRTDEAVADYAAFISTQARALDLRPFHRDAVALVIEHGARLDEHQQRLSTRFNAVCNLIVEAHHWAKEAGSDLVRAEHVSRALTEQDGRAGLIEDEVQRLIDEGTINIDTSSEVVGQVNGLSILDLGDFSFGRPSRITARTGLGSEGVVNIEREVKLSGPTHNKGVLILSGYLLGAYAQQRPLAVSARLTFEQVYDEVEGDSASGAELCALISSLADVPIRQNIAMTGSVNQRGEIQAVGGVTRKVEGFFAVCRARGFTGQQGVIIPESNVRHLMLEPEVVEAAERGEFHVWAVRTIDEALEVLTGVAAGARSAEGSYPDESIHGRAANRIAEFARRLAELTGRPLAEPAATSLGIRQDGENSP